MDGKEEALARRMRALGVAEEELVEKFITGSGAGGQKINKTASCVYLRHERTGVEVKCQEHRSREANRIRARELLCLKIEAERAKKRAIRKAEQAKERQARRKRSKKEKEKMLEAKRRRAQKKKLRKPPKHENE